MAVFTDDRLADFECSHDPKNRRYKVPKEYIVQTETRYGNNTYPKTLFDVKKVVASDESYEEFVSQLLALPSCDGEPYVGEDAETRGGSSQSKEIILNKEKFVWDGLPTGLLELKDGSWTSARDLEKRVVAVPSKSRSGLQDSCIVQIGRALGNSCHCILVVPLAELEEYVAMHGGHWLVMAPHNAMHDTIGDARRCVITIARSMKLQQVWMIDDSVPAEEIFRSKQAIGHRGEGIVHFVDALAEVEAFVEKRKKRKQVSNGRLAAVGIASTRSIETVRDSNPQVNERAPTGFVYILLDQLPADLTYDRRLPYKEDVLFAARTVQQGASVCVYRDLHFIDTRYRGGGCTKYHHM